MGDGPAPRRPLTLLLTVHLFLATLVAMNNWPLIMRLMQSPAAYVPGLGFFSPVVEIVLLGYVAAAAGLRGGGAWAWGLSLALQAFFSVTDGSVVRGAGLEVPLARAAFPWFLPYAANLLILILLFLPSVMARCGTNKVMKALDPVLVRLIGIEQLVLACLLMVLPWGYLIVYLPAAIFLAALNLLGVPLALARKPASRGLLLAAQATTALVLGAVHYRVNDGQGAALATMARWMMAVEVFATSAAAYLAAPVLARALSFRPHGGPPTNALSH